MLLSRREMLRLSSAGVLGVSLSGWLETLAGHAAEAVPMGKKHKSCILLWMDGGPAHLDTFDPKPAAPVEYRGDYGAIPTSVSGVQISGGLPKTAQVMHHGAILRGMSTAVNDHGGARTYMHTGYRAKEGGLDYPTIGSVVGKELGETASAMPNFVVTGALRNDNRLFLTSPGYLGAVHAPLVINDVHRGVENIKTHLEESRFGDRLTVLDELEKSFLKSNASTAAEAHRTIQQRAVQLMRSKAGQAYDLEKEPAASREAYGNSYFGKCCLLARRLVEVGVPFVEVYLPEWDTHDQNRAGAIKNLTMPQLDVAMAQLVKDLKDRGLLDTTLVVWMGEFGRTPRVKNGGGRDHFSRAWNTVLFGGGIKGGQVIGKTDATGSAVTERPIGVADFMATICSILRIDYNKCLTARGDRPVRITAKGANPIKELVG